MATQDREPWTTGRHPNQSALPPASGPAASPAWLIAADSIALVVFVAAGMRSHHEGSASWIFLRNAIPLFVAWFGVAALLKTYRTPGPSIVVKTWIVAVPLALVVRTLWVGSPDGARFFVFLGVGLAFTLLFLTIGRVLVTLIGRRVSPDRRRGSRPERRGA